MHSRSYKFRKSFENYQKAVEKHLNGDFLVYQYLNQNKLEGHNVDQYSELYNTMLVTKNQKKSKYNTLRVNYVQMTYEKIDQNLQSSKIQTWNGNKDQFCNVYQEILQKNHTKLQIQKNLWKQIVEVKMSLNLLKGDIGHLIGRNESAKTIQSKISKVKIVADDQFKRVALASFKDKDEFKTRNDMQRKFTKKLKNVSTFEDSNLKRLKQNYIDTMVKKRQIHDRLNYIQKVGSTISKTGQKQRLKDQKVKTILELYSCFMKLTNLIIHVPQAENKYLYNEQDYSMFGIHQFVNWLKESPLTIIQDINSQKSHQKSDKFLISRNSNDIEIITEQYLRNFENLVFVEHRRLKQEIQKKTSLYDIHMKKNEELIIKLAHFNHAIQKLQIDFCNQIGLNYIITSDIKQEYNQKLKNFKLYLKTIFALLEYLEKNIHYSTHQVKNIENITQTSSQFFVRKDSHFSCSKPSFQTLNLKITSTSSDKNNQCESLVWTSKNYISELYKAYNCLMHQNQDNISINNFQSNIYDYLQSDICRWLQLIKQSYLKGKSIRLQVPRKYKLQSIPKFRKSFSKHRQSRISVLMLPKTTTQIEQEETNQIIKENQFYEQMHLQHQSLKKQHPFKNNRSLTNSNILIHNHNINTVGIFNQNSQIIFSKSRVDYLKRFKHVTQHHQQRQAQRVKLLKDVDRYHYKMLKSTLMMEKQNTRKNYLFTRTFKRAKFSPRDQILEQKRFQCSFSMLFAENKNKLLKKSSFDDSKKSNLFKRGNIQRRLSKLSNSTQSVCSTRQIKHKHAQSKSSFSKNNISQWNKNVKTFKKPTQNKKSIVMKQKFSNQFKDIINLV